MKIYIAGKITGDPNYKAKFAKCAAFCRTMATVLNPAETPEGLTNADYANISIAMINAADAVAFLPDWEESKGARLEHDYCEYIGKPTAILREKRR